MNILFTRHAEDKFGVLERHGFLVSRVQVLDTMKKPDLIERSRLPLLIAQRRIDENHVLRVVYKKLNPQILKIITFYPGRRRDYESH